MFRVAFLTLVFFFVELLSNEEPPLRSGTRGATVFLTSLAMYSPAHTKCVTTERGVQNKTTRRTQKRSARGEKRAAPTNNCSETKFLRRTTASTAGMRGEIGGLKVDGGFFES